MRRQLQRGSRGSNLQQETYQNNNNKPLASNSVNAKQANSLSQSHEAADVATLHATCVLWFCVRVD